MPKMYFSVSDAVHQDFIILNGGTRRNVTKIYRKALRDFTKKNREQIEKNRVVVSKAVKKLTSSTIGEFDSLHLIELIGKKFFAGDEICKLLGTNIQGLSRRGLKMQVIVNRKFVAEDEFNTWIEKNLNGVKVEEGTLAPGMMAALAHAKG